MAANESIKVPDFVEFFSGMRGDPAWHLGNKDEGGEFLVPDVVIGRLAAQLLASEFYSSPWLEGCEPATVLLAKVLTGLASDNPKRVRKAVNAAYSAEVRILAMGVEEFVEWCLQGRPRELKPVAQPPARVVGIFEAKAQEIVNAIQALPNYEVAYQQFRGGHRGKYERVCNLLESAPGELTSYDIVTLGKAQEIMERIDARIEAEIHKGALLRLRAKLVDQSGGDTATHLKGSSMLKRANRHIQQLDSMKSLERPGASGDLRWALGLLLEKLNEAKRAAG